MGTTDTALESGSGRFGFVLAVEGYEFLLTDAADVDAVVTAWAGSGWTAALPGLKVVGGIKQSIEPLKPDLDIPELTFQIMDCDGLDTFGRAVWKNKPTISSRLNAPFTPAANGTGTITIKDNTGFASAGVAYVGTRALTYSAKVGGSGLTVSAASTYVPLAADTGNVYAWPNEQTTHANHDVAVEPRVQDVPPTWIGKKVALYIHRIVGDVWDVRAQARLEFAGKITGISEGEPGFTVLSCTDLRADIESAVLLRKQWVGYVKPGIYLDTWDKFKVKEVVQSGTSYTIVESEELTVLDSGASSTNEIDSGLYEYGEFIEKLNLWLTNDPNLTASWTARLQQTTEGHRTTFVALYPSDARTLHFFCNRSRIMDFMGFSQPKTDNEWLVVDSDEGYTEDSNSITSTNAPYRAMAVQLGVDGQLGLPVELESSEGHWFNHAEFSIDGVRDISDGATARSHVRIGADQIALASYSSDTLLANVRPMLGINQPFPKEDEAKFKPPGITFDDAAERLEIRQIVVLTDRFSVLMPRLFASIDGRGVNHATYDAFPWGAAIPWSVLGLPFVNSCKALEEAGETDVITLIIDRPTTLKDVLVPELALRFAFLVFKDGFYQFVSPPTPNASLAEFVLDETTKASADGNPPPSRSEWSAEYLVNVIKINHSRDASGKFVGKPLTFQDQTSIDVHGETKAVTIDAVNTTDASGTSEATLDNLAANLVTRLFPMFGHPVKLVTRTIAPTQYHIAPGDIVSLTDDLVRDSSTGARGVTDRACICLSSFHDYGHEGGTMAGEVVLLLSDEDRVFPLAPAAEVDTSYSSGGYTNGYDGTSTLRIKAHGFSQATASVDALRFEAGDEVRIIEMDPADPASYDAWTRTVDSVTADSIEFTAAISSPTWGGATKRYAVIPQRYAYVQPSQRLAAFQADEANGTIQGEAEPNAYGAATVADFADSDITLLPSLLADELAGDGRPVTPLQLDAFGRMANNLVNYKTATHVPLLPGRTTGVTSSTTWFDLLLVFPFYVGARQIAGRVRRIQVAPMAHVGGAYTGTIKVVTSAEPPNGITRNDSFPLFSGETRELEFSTTATSRTILTAQEFRPMAASGLPGYTWLSVLGKVSSAGTLTLDGIPTLSLLKMS